MTQASGCVVERNVALIDDNVGIRRGITAAEDIIDTEGIQIVASRQKPEAEGIAVGPDILITGKLGRCKGLRLIDPEPLSDEEKELFSVCPFKYLFNRIIKTPIEYSSEYHIKYYLSFALAFVVWKRTHGEQKFVNSEMDRSISELKKLFPFWGESVFADIKAQAGSGLRDAMTRSNPFSYWYIRRKRNFLVAKWTNQETGEEYHFQDPDVEEQWKEYMQSSQIYPLPDDLPPTGICNDCSFSEFCLRKFYNAHGDTEEG